MPDTMPHSEPPKTETYPGGPLPDHCIGGAVDGVSGGTARLLDGGTGLLAQNVMDNEIALFRHTDGKWYYRFDGVPAGSYRVQVTSSTGTSATTGAVAPGVAAGTTYVTS